MEAIAAVTQLTAAISLLPDSRAKRPWKYLDVSGLDLSPYAPVGCGPRRLQRTTSRGRSTSPRRLLCQQDGATTTVQTGNGVTVCDFAAPRRAAAAAAEQHLAQGVPAARSKFIALHYASLRGGVLRRRARATPCSPAPVRIVTRTYEARESAGGDRTRSSSTGANSRVNVIEDFRSSDAGHRSLLPVVEVLPGPGVARSALHGAPPLGQPTRACSRSSAARSSKDSAFVALNLVDRAASVVKEHRELHRSKAGGSSSELFGLALGDADTAHRLLHRAGPHRPPTRVSDLLVQVRADRSTARSVYYGLTRVGLGATERQREPGEPQPPAQPAPPRPTATPCSKS